MGHYEKAISELREATGYDPDKDGSVDDLIAYKDALEDRLASLLGESGDHLDFVNVVEVEGREDGIYVFAHRQDADRFEAAAAHDSPEIDRSAWIIETPINVGDAAERLIASERADVLEEMGYGSVADEVRRGTSPSQLAALVEEGSDAEREIGSLLQHWAEEDAKGGQS